MTSTRADAEHQQALEYLLAELTLKEGEAEKTLTTKQIAADLKWDHEKTVGSVRHLSGREVLTVDMVEVVEWVSTHEGQQYAESGTPEAQIARYIIEKQPIALTDLKVQCKEGLGLSEQTTDVGVGHCMKNKWISRRPEDKALVSTLTSINDAVQAQLKIVAKTSDSTALTAVLFNRPRVPQRDVRRDAFGGVSSG
eukprot:Selendium_serpulae@DN5718_c0_g1_i3.p1